MPKLRCPTIAVSRISTTGKTQSPGTGRVRARKATRLARPRVGAWPLRGTEGSNPLPSSGESVANLTQSMKAPKILTEHVCSFAFWAEGPGA
jgi:hypothetical protein